MERVNEHIFGATNNKHNLMLVYTDKHDARFQSKVFSGIQRPDQTQMRVHVTDLT